MPLWGNNDNAANSDIAAVQQINLPVSTDNQTNLYANTTGNVFIDRVTVGQFGIGSSEQQVLVANSQPKGAHAGWNLRTVGQGGRAGRVFYETLVAMGSFVGDGNEDSILADVFVKIVGQPTANDVLSGNAVTYSIWAEPIPADATLTYQWRRNGANVADTGVYSGNTTSTLTISDNTGLDGNTFNVSIWVNGIARVNSSSVLLTEL